MKLFDTPPDSFKSYLGHELLRINGEPIGAILEEMLSMMSGERIEFKCSCLPMTFSKLFFVLRGVVENYSLEIAIGSSSEVISVPGISREQSKLTSVGN